MPGSNTRALDKARSLPADCIIMDLEDAVAPDQKDAARGQVAGALAAGGYQPREIIVRINGPGTPWHDADVAAIVAARPDAILVPKVETPDDLVAVADRVAAVSSGARVPLWAMIETPIGVTNVGSIAAVARQAPRVGLEAFVLGTNDLVKETRMELDADRREALYWLCATVTAGRGYRLDVLDGVYNTFKDVEGFAKECRQGRRLGMTGKTLIHPDQIAIANGVFQPSPEEIEMARRIIEAFERPENAGRGAITLDGRMVELLHAEIARTTIEVATAIAGRAHQGT